MATTNKDATSTGCCRGQIQLSIYVNHGLLTVHVLQGRNLSERLPTFVTVSIESDCQIAQTRPVQRANYDEKFSFELCNNWQRKRIVVSVFQQSPSSNETAQFLGCTSFGIHHLLCGKKVMNDWYYLLKKKVGEKKHLRVPHSLPSVSTTTTTTTNNSTTIPSVNKSLSGMSSATVSLERNVDTSEEFGLTVSGSCPVRINSITVNSPAWLAGLRIGDCLVRINNRNVSRSCWRSVEKLLNSISGSFLILDVYRKREKTTSSSIGSSTATGRSLGSYRSCEGATHNEQFKEYDIDDMDAGGDCIPQQQRQRQEEREEDDYLYERYDNEMEDENEENIYETIYENIDLLERNIDPEDKENLPSPSVKSLKAIRPSSYYSRHTTYKSPVSGLILPPPAGCSSPDASLRGCGDNDNDRLSCIRDLVDSEREFSTKIKIGTLHYSAPLRHLILKANQNSILFSNIEKLGQFSDFQLGQLDPPTTAAKTGNCRRRRHITKSNYNNNNNNNNNNKNKYNQDSDSDSDNHLNDELEGGDMNIGGLYKPRLRMLTDAYKLYAKNLHNALTLLNDLQTNRRFVDFYAKHETKELTLSQFILLPIRHLRKLLSMLQTLLNRTVTNHRDFDDLSFVVQALLACYEEINQNGLLKRRKRPYNSDTAAGTTNTPMCESNNNPIHSDIVLWASDNKQNWMKTNMILFQDRLILTNDTDVNLLCSPPIYFDTISHIDFHIANGTEFSMSVIMQIADDLNGIRKFKFRAPTFNQKANWESLLQRYLPV